MIFVSMRYISQYLFSEKVMCEMKCMKMMMSNIMHMDVKMNVALMNKMQECDEIMNATMSMMQAMKEKCC
ncbi:hypothetical protein [Bacillus sp. CDB3]|uniref:hypothetical protein n=1 Tax=Bacillus sp. CDB3 TaxID=360310 RepID=UPI0009D80A91|nr:hypothetical protein [Bacillus sp. CDB3]OQR53468.1 hypothetical protein CDB3_29740 [Bacillus sp. CDB3]